MTRPLLLALAWLATAAGCGLATAWFLRPAPERAERAVSRETAEGRPTLAARPAPGAPGVVATPSTEPGAQEPALPSPPVAAETLEDIGTAGWIEARVTTAEGKPAEGATAYAVPVGSAPVTGDGPWPRAD